ncbi:MAG: hypothetical protein QNJ77_03540 [Acidimicrobiia bacterium]|nr:hypothetical protein [Acidimicrobiia bacterium]
MRNRVLVVLAAVAVLMTVAVAAQAQETDASVEGKGYIWAKGSGMAILDGRGRVHMAIDGDVVIYDYAGDAVVKIGAVPEEEPDGEGARLQEVSPTTTYTFDNFRGRMQVVGSDFRIEAEGDMKFRGHGEGVVELDGRGWWKTLRKRGTWSGTVLQFGDAEAEER